MAVGKATVIRNGVEVPYDPATMQGADPTLKGSGWIQKDGGTFYYDANTNTYNSLDKMKAIIAGNSPETVDRMVKAYGYNSAADFLAGSAPVEKAVAEQKAVADTAMINNPSVSSAVNAGANPRRTVLDSAIVPYIQLGRVDPTTGKNSYNEEVARAEAQIQNPTGMAEQDKAAQAAEEIRKYGTASDLEKQFQKYLGEKVSDKGVEEYGSNVYKRAMLEFERAAQLDRERNASDLAARGLGMSTVVNDVNSAVDRDLATNRQKSFYDSNTTAQDYIAKLMGQGIGMENNIGNRGIAANESSANALGGIGINKANIQTGVENRMRGLNEVFQQNALLNYGLQEAANDKSVANVKYLLNFPYATNEAGNQSSVNATNESNTRYQGLMNAYNTQQEGIGKLLGGVLTNALAK